MKIKNYEHPFENHTDSNITGCFEKPENFECEGINALRITKNDLTKHLFINGPQGTCKSYSFLKLVEEMVKDSDD